jgi:hypothetical protein
MPQNKVGIYYSLIYACSLSGKINRPEKTKRIENKPGAIARNISLSQPQSFCLPPP